MSATLQVDTFAKNERLFAVSPPVVKVDARQYPVTLHFDRRTPDDHIPAVIRKVSRIHCRLPAGGVLVFLTGKREIDYVVQKLRKKFGRKRRQAQGGGGSAPAALDPSPPSLPVLRESPAWYINATMR